MHKPEHDFRAIDWHCHKLASVLTRLDAEALIPMPKRRRDDGSLGNAGDWLQLAAEVKQVTLQLITEDAGIMWGLCESAVEYDNAKSQLHANFVTKITRFTFAWNAFEVVVRSLGLKSHPDPRWRSSAAKSATWFIRRMGVRPADYEGYLHVLQHALRHAKEYPEFERVLLPPENDRLHISEAGYGVELCRLWRNKLAHGAARLPEPEEWRMAGIQDKALLCFIDTLVRLLLLSIQMVIVSQAGKLEPIDELSMLFDDSGPDVSAYVRCLHLDRPSYRQQQEENEELEGQ